MKRYNNAEMFFEDYKSMTDEDKKAIIKALEIEIEIHVDGQGRVWNEGNIYIADVTKTKKKTRRKITYYRILK